jgi:glycosyltransferase involved in cell wall biosynthesis
MRLGVLSNDRLDPWINWTTLGPPLLNALAAHDGGVLISPPFLKASNHSEWRSTLQRASGADTLFWMQGASRPEMPLFVLSALRGRVRRAAYVIDAWKPILTKIGALAVAQRLDPCFVAFREAYEELTQRFPRGRFEWLPFGVDTSVFEARPDTDRDIFVYWMGRRYGPLHEALVRYCAERGLTYKFTRTPGEFKDPRELGRIVGRSRYFVVTPPDLDNPARTGGFSPFVMRYLEGLAAGARLLGVLPRSGEYAALLPRESILTVAPDGSDLAEKLDRDKDEPVARANLEAARLFVRENHSWQRRAEQIHSRLTQGMPVSMPVPPALPSLAPAD